MFRLECSWCIYSSQLNKVKLTATHEKQKQVIKIALVRLIKKTEIADFHAMWLSTNQMLYVHCFITQHSMLQMLLRKLLNYGAWIVFLFDLENHAAVVVLFFCTKG